MENDKRREQLKMLTDEYLQPFLGFAVKRTNSFNEAEELAQEIAAQCVKAIHKSSEINNFNAFLWSIAHNTYKRWLSSNKKNVSFNEDIEYIGQVLGMGTGVDDNILDIEEMDELHRRISFLNGYYRKTLVYFYYEEMSISDIACKLNISDQMVKYYLGRGREQIKEAYTMEKVCGEKSYNPCDFSVFYSGIDFSRVNVWNVFKRKLPCQIAMICYEGPASVSKISLETGTPAVYIEDEISLLLEAGVMIESSKGKYRTNFFILKKEALSQLQNQFKKLMEIHTPKVIEYFDRYLEEMKGCDIFKFDADDSRYAWNFARNVTDFDYSSIYLSDEDYPVILSCGARAFIFAAEADTPVWGAGTTPTQLDKCVVWPCDIGILGPYRHQDNLRSPEKAQTLYDTYTGEISPSKEELYARMIEEGYVLKEKERLVCNVAVSTAKSRALFDKINGELTEFIKPICREISENITRIVKSTLPPQLKDYARGFAVTEIMFYAGISLFEALYDRGFLALPGKGSKQPVACYIYEK